MEINEIDRDLLVSVNVDPNKPKEEQEEEVQSLLESVVLGRKHHTHVVRNIARGASVVTTDHQFELMNSDNEDKEQFVYRCIDNGLLPTHLRLDSWINQQLEEERLTPAEGDALSEYKTVIEPALEYDYSDVVFIVRGELKDRGSKVSTNKRGVKIGKTTVSTKVAIQTLWRSALANIRDLDKIVLVGEILIDRTTTEFSNSAEFLAAVTSLFSYHAYPVIDLPVDVDDSILLLESEVDDIISTSGGVTVIDGAIRVVAKETDDPQTSINEYIEYVWNAKGEAFCMVSEEGSDLKVDGGALTISEVMVRLREANADHRIYIVHSGLTSRLRSVTPTLSVEVANADDSKVSVQTIKTLADFVKLLNTRVKAKLKLIESNWSSVVDVVSSGQRLVAIRAKLIDSGQNLTQYELNLGELEEPEAAEEEDNGL